MSWISWLRGERVDTAKEFLDPLYEVTVSVMLGFWRVCLSACLFFVVVLGFPIYLYYYYVGWLKHEGFSFSTGNLQKHPYQDFSFQAVSNLV